MSFKSGVVAGYVDTAVKEWTVKVGDKVTAGDLLCVVTYDTYNGPAERKVISEDYGTVERIFYQEGEAVPKGEAVCLIVLDDRYYMHRAIDFAQKKGETTLSEYEEILCKLSAPGIAEDVRNQWIAELTDWTTAMKGIFDEYIPDRAKAVDYVISIYLEMDFMDIYVTHSILVQAAKDGKVKNLSEYDADRIDLDRFEVLVNEHIKYCKELWTSPYQEERANIEKRIRRIVE